MSSLRNAIPRRPHRERAQPHERRKYGLLEKHKDYSLRAKDYAAKQARLRVLRQKVVDAHPDEFHFAMMSSRVDKDGVKVADRGNKSLGHDVVKLLKTQDRGYLQTMATKTTKDREKLEEKMLMQAKDLKKKNGKLMVFVEDDEAKEDFNADAYLNTDKSGIKRTADRPRRSDGTQEVASSEEKNVASERESLRKSLAAIKEREKTLMLALEGVDKQRAKMSNNIGGVNKNGVRYKIRTRKR